MYKNNYVIKLLAATTMLSLVLAGCAQKAPENSAGNSMNMSENQKA